MQTEDGYIIQKCLEGEPEAFAFLVDKYMKSVYAFAYGKLCNFQDAEDVAQEVFVKVYKKLPALKHWDSFRAWLYVITSNECKALIRSRQNRPDKEFIEDQNATILDNHSIDSYKEDSVREMINDALSSLPEIYSQVLAMHYLGGMSIKEIAAFLGTSIDSVKQRLSRARTMLREEVIAMMSATYEQQKLPANFTFKIVEMVKRIKLRPTTQIKGLPYGLSLATGLIVAFFGLNPLINFDQFGIPANSPLPVEAKVLKVGEIPVDIVKTANISVISSGLGKGKGGIPIKPDLQNAFFMAPQAGDTWTKKADMPIGRIGCSASVVDGKIYVIGGGLGGGTPAIEYDPDADKWTTKKAGMPTERSDLSTSEVNGKIYAIGGMVGVWVPISTVEEYDPATDTWANKADMPTARECLSTSAVNGKIYAIGGCNGSNLSTVEEYDPVADKWTKKADMPTARENLSTSVVNDKIYAIGGDDFNIGVYYSAVEEYDPVADKWTKKADMPTARYCLATSAVNGKIYAIGGCMIVGQQINLSIVEEYDPVTNKWTKKANMPTARSIFQIGAVNGRIYAMGGQCDDANGWVTVEEYDTGFRDESVEAKWKFPTTWGSRKSSE